MARLGNGSSEKLAIAAAVVAGPPLTMGCWFRPDRDGPIGNLMALCRASSSVGFLALRVRGDLPGDPLEAIHQENSPGAAGFASSGPVRWDRWQHGLAVFTSAASRAVYLNGIGAIDSTAVGPTTPDRTSLLVNDRGGSPVHHFSGAIAHAAIWSAALTPGEATALASGVSPLLIRPHDLVEYWPLEGLGRREEVGAVAGRTLVATGTSWAAGPIGSPAPAPALQLAVASARAIAPAWHDGPVAGSIAAPPPRRPVKWYPGLSSRRRRRGA